MNYAKVVHTIDDPLDQQLFDRKQLMDALALRCPVCGDPFSHAQAVYTLIGGDESDGLYRGSHLIARETPYRRDAIAVRVHGETCGHRWDIVFQQHKGNTLVRIDVLEDITGSSDRPISERRY